MKEEYIKRLSTEDLSPENLTASQRLELQQLNKKLVDIEKKLKMDLLNLYLLAEERIKDPHDWIEDYEIEICLRFIVKEDDIYHDEDLDNILVGLDEYSNNPNDTFLSDGRNHSEFQNWENHTMHKEHHCWLYHCLYDHTDLDWQNILRIGTIWVDIKIEYQRIIGL